MRGEEERGVKDDLIFPSYTEHLDSFSTFSQDKFNFFFFYEAESKVIFETDRRSGRKKFHEDLK